MIKVKLINTDYNIYSDVIENLINNFSESGVIIKDSRNVIKSFESNKVIFNIKSFKIPNIFNAFIYNKIRLSKAERSYRFAQKLLSFGINTPEPIAYFEFKTSLFLKNSYYVSKNIDYDFSIRQVIKDSNFKNREKILKLFSRFTFKLHENNINYLDHSPGNTLIQVYENDYRFYLIDLNRMEFKKMTFKNRMQNFNRLTVDPNIIRIFSEEYASLYNVDIELVYKKMLFYSEKFFSDRDRLKKIKKFKF
ncbi:lipopolysaccharide kinase InaA family protein [Flavobacteriaceae bacterium]|nr:lipopolysaccharide kinase InaA family protein [Flavobacteriaceae bacterium]